MSPLIIGLYLNLNMMFQPNSPETIISVNPNAASGTKKKRQIHEIPQVLQIPQVRKWSRSRQLRPWVLHAPAATLTVVNTNPIELTNRFAGSLLSRIIFINARGRLFCSKTTFGRDYWANIG